MQLGSSSCTTKRNLDRVRSGAEPAEPDPSRVVYPLEGRRKLNCCCCCWRWHRTVVAGGTARTTWATFFWRPRRPSRRPRSARCAARRPSPRALRRLCWVADDASEDKAAAYSLSVIGADADIVSRASDRAGSFWATRPSRRPARCPTRRSPSCPSRRLSWPTPRPRARLLPSRST